MSKLRCCIFILFALIVMLFSVSCDNTSFSGSEVIIEEPSFIIDTTDGKSLVSPSPKIDMYKLKMEPQWVSGSYNVVGDTTKNANADKYGYIIVEPPFNNLGFFSQGLWNFGLQAYTKNLDNEYVLVYQVEKEVAINSDSTTISISASEILPTDSTIPCTIKLTDFDFLCTGPITEYGKSNDLGMKLSYKLVDLTNTSVVYKEVFVEDSTKIESNGSDTSVGIINSLDILVYDNSGKKVDIYSGAYSLSVYLNEYVDGKWVHTGGTSISFVSVPGIELHIAGETKSIDLCRYDYVTPGTSGGIEIDSGTNSTVVVKGYKVVNGEETELSTSVKVITSDTVKFKPVVTNGPATITSYKWFIDGVEPAGTAIDTNGCLTYQPTTAKTYTITYMFLDGTSYNTISGNYYLTVTAS